MIVSEQGIGDNLQFAQYFFWLKEKFNSKIYFYTDSKIAHLFKNCPITTIDNLDGIEEIDYFQSLLSLPGIYFKETKKFFFLKNYIISNKETDLKWEKKLKHFKKPIICLNWQGDNKFVHDSDRSINLSKFKNIVKNKNFDFISLQKDIGKNHIKKK